MQKNADLHNQPAACDAEDSNMFISLWSSLLGQIQNL